MSAVEMLPVSAFDTDTLLSEIKKWVEFETPSDRPDLISHLLDYVESLYKGYDVTCERLPPVARRGGQLILRYNPSRSSAAPVLFMGHVDTVWEAGTLAKRPYRRDGDRVYGPGIFDMKAGSCLAVMTLLKLASDQIVPSRPVTVFLNSDEEIGSDASRQTIERLGREASVILVPEPSFEAPGTVVTARKGWATFRLDVTGVSAHAGGSLREGRSAIVELARQILAIEALMEREPRVTFNVGKIGGGTRGNVVAEKAWVEIDMRVETMEVADRVIEELCALPPFDPAIQLQLSGEMNRPPFQRTSQVADLYEWAKRLAKDLGIELGETSRGGVSDGNLVACLGKPVLDGLGCSGAGAHALHEHILASTVAPRAALLFALATQPGFDAR